MEADHRHAVQLPDGFNPARIAGGDFADVAEVGRGALFARAKEQPVAAGESDGRLPERAESRDEALVHLAGEDHQRDVAGFGIGDAQAVDEFALLAQRLQRARQLHAAAMDHGHLVAIAHQVGNGAHAAIQQRRSFKARAAEFDTYFIPALRFGFIRDLPLRQPSITFMFCTAWPAAPFSRLSRQLTITARRPSRRKLKSDVGVIGAHRVLNLRQRVFIDPHHRAAMQKIRDKSAPRLSRVCGSLKRT